MDNTSTPGVSRWTPAFRRQYQRQYRQSLLDRGGMRLEIQLQPKTAARLAEFLEDYGFASHPGSALAKWLDDEFKE